MQQATLVKYGKVCVSWSVGHPPKTGNKDPVLFDQGKLWDFMLSMSTEEADPSVLHFYHVHPPSELLYSEQDIETVRKINKSLGFSALFSIVGFSNPSDLQDNRFEIATYRYDEKSKKMSVSRNKDTLTTAEATTLKALYTATIF